MEAASVSARWRRHGAQAEAPQPTTCTKQLFGCLSALLQSPITAKVRASARMQLQHQTRPDQSVDTSSSELNPALPSGPEIRTSAEMWTRPKNKHWWNCSQGGATSTYREGQNRAPSSSLHQKPSSLLNSFLHDIVREWACR